MKTNIIKKCTTCNKELGRNKKRFCGDLCYIKYKKERDKKRYNLFRANFPEMPCSICGDIFKPIRKNNTACSRVCSSMQARNRQQIKRVKKRKLPKVGPLEKKPLVIVQDFSKFKRVNTAEFNPSDNTKSAVEEYLKKGNTILKFPDEPRPKIPSVNIVNGHSIETVMGFGLEFEYDSNMRCFNYNFTAKNLRADDY